MKLNSPVLLVMATMIIMPIKSPSVLKSTWWMAVSCVMMPMTIMRMAPTIAMIVR